MNKSAYELSPRSGRPKVAQRFSAGNVEFYGIKSAADGRHFPDELTGKCSVARFTGSGFLSSERPSTEVLGYNQSSAARTELSFLT